jgi:hypothetical protein
MTPYFILTDLPRCTDGVVGDLRNMGVQSWRMVARERESNEREHEVPQEVEGHRSYSANKNIAATAAAADNDINDV